jgi:hypothetical protein
VHYIRSSIDALSFPVDVGELQGLKATVLVGDWMFTCGRSYTNGMEKDDIEFERCHEVTETITVKKWKPINVKPCTNSPQK